MTASSDDVYGVIDSADQVLLRELCRARAELDALEDAVDELPKILEDKFRQRLAVVVETNRQLAVQKQILMRQLAASLPPVGSGQVSPHVWTHDRRLRVCFPTFRIAKRSVWMALLTCFALLVLARAITSRAPHRQPGTTAKGTVRLFPAPDSESQLILRAGPG